MYKSFPLIFHLIGVCVSSYSYPHQTAEECKSFLRSYKDHPAECVNGVVVTNVKTGKQVEGNYIAKQHFKEIPESAMDELIKKGDVMSCCGGFVVEQMGPYLAQ